MEPYEPKKKKTSKKSTYTNGSKNGTGTMVMDSPLAVAKTQIKKAQIKAKTAKEVAAVTIDYPQQGEKIQPLHYAVRLSVKGSSTVEIAIDENDWNACRESVGYYWHDWAPISKGSHKLTARIKLSSGKYKETKTITCRTI